MQISLPFLGPSTANLGSVSGSLLHIEINDKNFCKFLDAKEMNGHHEALHKSMGDSLIRLTNTLRYLLMSYYLDIRATPRATPREYSAHLVGEHAVTYTSDRTPIETFCQLSPTEF